MGCTKSINNTQLLTIKTKMNDFFNSYKIINEIIHKIKKCNEVDPPLKVYLISTSSIPIYIKIIKNNKSDLDKLINEKENIDLNLELLSYESDNNIIIYNDYQKCMNILEQNDETKNEFIIVNDKFLSFMKIKDFKHKEVEIKKVKSKNEIIFPASQNSLLLDKKTQYSFKFSKQNKSIMNKFNYLIILFGIKS